MLDEQTEVLNKAYSGGDRCDVAEARAEDSTNMRIKFREVGRFKKIHGSCRKDCSKCFSRLTKRVVPREDGKVKEDYAVQVYSDGGLRDTIGAAAYAVLLVNTNGYCTFALAVIDAIFLHEQDSSFALEVIFCELGALLGFSSFPGDPDSKRVLIVHPGTVPGGFMEPFDLGDTVVHEMGHYLGLLHTFQGGCREPGDEINDTRAEREPHYGCPPSMQYRRTTCPGAETSPFTVTDPISNFMDYSDDRCMCKFTPEQRRRIFGQLKALQPDLYRLKGAEAGRADHAAPAPPPPAEVPREGH